MGVVAGAHNHKVGLKRCDLRLHQVPRVHRRDVPSIPRQLDVERGPNAGPHSRLGDLPGAREATRHMRRHEKHRVVVVKDVLRAVAMVHVKVDDGDALDHVAIRLLNVARCHGRVVYDAKSHRPRRARVMTRRTDQRKASRHNVVVRRLGAGLVQGVRAHDLVHHRLDDTSRGERVHVRAPSQVRALVQHDTRDRHGLAGLVLQSRQVPLIMDEENVLQGCRLDRARRELQVAVSGIAGAQDTS
mmetsp:Transcript_8578/g.23243  ORF Transcript_8578/g.23243 Transcript_8578/m.23243 type:complete len:244 (-) Transcript_8578:316-1047(-)